MQEFDLYSMWLSEDDIVNSIFEESTMAMGSVEAANKFAKYYPDRLKMGKFTTFYYTEESANAALVKKQHRFVNLIKVHVQPMEIDAKPLLPLDTDVEFEVVRDGEESEEAEDENEEAENDIQDEDELPADIIETSGEANDQLSPIPNECDLMTLQEFIDSVKDGLFVDYDGHGRYANSMMMSPELIYPSDVIKGVILEGWTHVAWFNK